MALVSKLTSRASPVQWPGAALAFQHMDSTETPSAHLIPGLHHPRALTLLTLVVQPQAAVAAIMCKPR